MRFGCGSWLRCRFGLRLRCRFWLWLRCRFGLWLRCGSWLGSGFGCCFWMRFWMRFWSRSRLGVWLRCGLVMVFFWFPMGAGMCGRRGVMSPDPDMVHIIPALVVRDVLVVVPAVAVFVFGRDVLMACGCIRVKDQKGFASRKEERDRGDCAKKNFVQHYELLRAIERFRVVERYCPIPKNASAGRFFEKKQFSHLRSLKR